MLSKAAAREKEEQEIYGNVRQTKTDRKAIIGNAM